MSDHNQFGYSAFSSVIMEAQSFTVWESQHLVIWGLVHIPFEMMQLGDNSRITTEWGKLETAKKILESGGGIKQIHSGGECLIRKTRTG
jgi:hypothetical protein